jgi:hypothetical protein
VLRVVVPTVLLLAAATAAVGATAPVGAPSVSGPRTTTLEQPQFRFRAARAVSFRCAFDSKRLHGCRARFSQRLLPGKHTLRVRAVAGTARSAGSSSSTWSSTSPTRG